MPRMSEPARHRGVPYPRASESLPKSLAGAPPTERASLPRTIPRAGSATASTTLSRRSVAPATVTAVLSNLSSCLEHGMEWHGLTWNPVRELPRRRRPGAKRQAEPRYLSADELDSLLLKIGDRTFRTVGIGRERGWVTPNGTLVPPGTEPPSGNDEINAAIRRAAGRES
jgi:hypothetical protein